MEKKIIVPLDFWFPSNPSTSVNSHGYTILNKDRDKILLHKYLLNYEGDDVVDHINNNRLDNRKSNLRICTRAQNAKNRSFIEGTSKFAGVYYDKNIDKWRVAIRVDGIRYNLGSFINENKAAHVRDQASLKYFKEFAKLNFPIILERIEKKKNYIHYNL